MKTKNLRLIGIAMASGACWWCATARSPLPSPVSALAAPNARVNAETAHACQSVVYQMVAIQQIVKDERQSGTIRPLAAMDELVGEESRIDTSKCPDDFRQAYSHFVGAEDSWRNHVYGDMIGKSEILAGAVAQECLSPITVAENSQSLIGSDLRISDQQRHDVAAIQATLQTLAQTAEQYGVK